MRLTPIEVHEQTFRTTFRGFDPVEVDSFLNHVAEEMERLIEEKTALDTELSLERSTKAELEDLLSVARQLQNSIVEKAKEDARIVMNQAELLAERITQEAQDKASEIRRDIGALKGRKAELMAELSGLAHSLGQWVERMDEKSSAGPEDREFSQPYIEEATPLIRLATENTDGEEGGTPQETSEPVDENDVETFDVDGFGDEDEEF